MEKKIILVGKSLGIRLWVFSRNKPWKRGYYTTEIMTFQQIDGLWKLMILIQCQDQVNDVLKIDVFAVYIQSDILGKDAWTMDEQGLCETGSTVKTLLTNTLYFQWADYHHKLYDVFEKSSRGNNDSQSSCWLPSFPTLDKCCSAPPPSYFSILYPLTEIGGRAFKMFVFRGYCHPHGFICFI